MTLRALLAIFDPPPADTLTDDQRAWLHTVATTRDIYRTRQAALEQRIAEVAADSVARLEDPAACRRREFWARNTPQPPARVVPMERRPA